MFSLCLLLLEASAPTPLQFDARIDVPAATVLFGGVLLSDTVFKPSLASATCRACDPNALDSWATGIRASGAGLARADALSYVSSALLPLGALLFSGWQSYEAKSWRLLLEDVSLAVEATFAAMAVTQVTKYAVARERPFVHRLAPEDKALVKDPSDNNLSFFSGHTTLAFGFAVSAGTLAALRGYSKQPMVWGVGLSLATATGVLRMVADKHYLTDVLVGAAVGSAAGFLIPWLHRETSMPVHVAVGPSGCVVWGTF